MQQYKQNILLLVYTTVFVTGFIYSFTAADELKSKFYISLALLSLIGIFSIPGISNNKKQKSYDKD